MNLVRGLLLAIIMISGCLIIYSLATHKLQPKIIPTLAPLFQLAGKSTQAVDKLLSKIMPVNDIDEKEFGIAIKHKLENKEDTSLKDVRYLNELINNMAIFSKKDFSYRIFIKQSAAPNSFAMPGGVLIVTSGLLETLKSESELVSVIAHEIGHIELGHCFEAVKFELLTRKIIGSSLGKIIDITNHLFLRHSFSKTQENDADEYSFQLILQTEYDPAGVSGALSNIYSFYSRHDNDSDKLDILRDYMMSHPPMQLRINKFNAEADRWWNFNPTHKRYVGEKNLKKRKSYYSTVFNDEWVSMKSR